MRLATAVAVGLAIWGLTTAILFIAGTRAAFSVNKAIGQGGGLCRFQRELGHRFLLGAIVGICSYFLNAWRLLLFGATH